MKGPRPPCGSQSQISTAPDIDWDLIRGLAAEFSLKWKDAEKENAEAQSFWNDFFKIFGRDRRGLAHYEYHARARGLTKRIDLLWPGVLGVEHKSKGGDLDAAQKQLENYILILEDDEKPRYGLVCDFAHFRLIDFYEQRAVNFPLADLPANAEEFGFFIEHRNRRLALELKASRDAAEKMGGIYDALTAAGYRGEIDRLLVRLLFCMFADDTGIFPINLFRNYLEDETREDGSDLGMHLSQIFDVLNTKTDRRPKNLPASLAQFPYVNGELFNGNVGRVYFDRQTREAVLDACRFDWKDISPDIFGALFQSVRGGADRRSGGEHYTSEENIMKVIRPLFLDGLEAELERAGKNKRALEQFHEKIATLRFLDPACGCGNFLIVAYRELRRLEMKILVRMKTPAALDVRSLVRVRVDQFYGMEIDGFPARIAQAAMWLVAHQMNLEMRELFGKTVASIPLTVAAHVREGNALDFDWRQFVSPAEISFVFGNPPFAGNYLKTAQQKADMERVFGENEQTGKLDYVAAWYFKAAEYIRGTKIKCAFVSTNSITQGEQVAVLWGVLQRAGVKIHFAHRTFRWRNEGAGMAGVYVVVIGFGMDDIDGKAIYVYENVRSEPKKIAAKNINPYLADAPDILVKSRTAPFGDAPSLISGSIPADGGHLILSARERKELLEQYPEAAEFVRPAISARTYLHGERRWCLWLSDAEPSAYRHIRPIAERLDKVRKQRRKSPKAKTREMQHISHCFGEIRQPDSNYILLPLTTSEARRYIPIGLGQKRNIALKSCAMLPRGDLYYFGVLTSAMHMEWMRAVAGRLKSDYRYSNKMVYNTFPWPQKVSAAQKQKIADCAQAVLDVRKDYAASTLADMYSNMPADLLAAHRALDRAVDRAYRPAAFADESARLNFLFAEYSRLIDEESAAAPRAHSAAPAAAKSRQPRKRKKQCQNK